MSLKKIWTGQIAQTQTNKQMDNLEGDFYIPPTPNSVC